MRSFSIASLALIATAASLVQAEWQITSLPIGEREGICSQNTAYCLNNCNNKAPMNFCNAKTMGWNCGCAEKTPDLAEASWPIVRAECRGRATDCQSTCQKDPAKMTDCYAKCADTYQCDAGKMPASNLRVKDVSTAPDYASSASTGNGTKGSNAADSLTPSAVSLSYTAGALIVVAGAMLTL
ncbi:hypothetical protein BDF19DRAFT_449552 [Syncephalis fuscata]|nr:hypothetical protein BDF19DRAFT_449552 [Syncephalis fuscata]